MLRPLRAPIFAFAPTYETCRRLSLSWGVHPICLPFDTDPNRKALPDTIIVTGGKQPGDRFTESKAGEIYLIEQGIPAQKILLEERGTTTLESLRGVDDIAEDREFAPAG